MKLKMSGNEDHHRQGRRFAARGNGHDERDPRDVEIERLRQRIHKLETNPFDTFEELEYPFFEGDGSSSDECEGYEGPPVFDEEECEEGNKPESENEEVVYANQGEFLVCRNLSVQRKGEDDWLRHNIFHTRCTSHGKVCDIIIDGESLVEYGVGLGIFIDLDSI